MLRAVNIRKFDHPQTREKLVERLMVKYKQHGSLIVGFDFDHTIFDYDNEGGDYSCVIELLKTCSELGFVMVLWTTEPDEEKLRWKIQYCKDKGIRVDYVNESPASKFKDCKKPYFNILLDDVAGLEEAYYILSEAVKIIIEEKEGKTKTPFSEEDFVKKAEYWFRHRGPFVFPEDNETLRDFLEFVKK